MWDLFVGNCWDKKSSDATIAHSDDIQHLDAKQSTDGSLENMCYFCFKSLIQLSHFLAF